MKFEFEFVPNGPNEKLVELPINFRHYDTYVYEKRVQVSFVGDGPTGIFKICRREKTQGISGEGIRFLSKISLDFNTYIYYIKNTSEGERRMIELMTKKE